MYGYGAFYNGNTGSVIQASLSGSTTRQVIFNASRSAEIYGKSETVQPAALSATPQIKY